MGKSFYLKLALNNLKRNQKKFVPYFIAATIMISIYFLVLMIIYTPGLADIPESQYLKELFKIGHNTLNVFMAVFMFYINSFLIKQRKKELGLYGILGLEKRHIGLVMLWENLLINGSAILSGIGTACIFGYLVFMLLLKSVNVTHNTYFALPLEAFTITLLYFFLLFFVIFIFNVFQVRMANPIDLLKSDHAGEKKTRFLIPMTILGLGILGYAYYTAWTVSNPFLALNQFFLAVIMVIVATYILFTSGSIALLKLLKKNKRYYYKPDNFISVAGMVHRMKQNASGLASICILSSMVLVTVSTCIALYLEQEEAITVRNQDDIVVEVFQDTTEEQCVQLVELFDKIGQENNISIENEYHYFSSKGVLVYENNQFEVPGTDFSIFNKNVPNNVTVNYLALSDYNRICGTQVELTDNQILLLSNGDYEKEKEFVIEDQVYLISDYSTESIFTNGKNRKALDEVYFVVRDRENHDRIVENINSGSIYGRSIKFILNIKGSSENCYQFVNQLKNEYGKVAKAYDINSIYQNRYDGYSMFGGLLFIGAFFTILFLCATVLIIYFKQVSEGYEDKTRFEMLQKVGMDDLEVKKTINKQIRIVFFLPLLSALLHVTVASKMIIKLLEVLDLYNVALTRICIFGSCVVFTLVYIIVYRLTARTYCKIVKW